MKSSRILVADDDEIALGAIAEMLEEAGYDLVLASSGTQVIKHLSDEVEVALLDLHMPPPDGMECLRHIARHWPATGPPSRPSWSPAAWKCPVQWKP